MATSRTSVFLRRLAFVMIAAASLAGCAVSLPTLNGHSATSSGPGERWAPSSREAGPTTAPAKQEPGLGPKLKALALADAVDIALRNNPSTRAVWENAVAAANALGEKEGQNYPAIGLDLSVAGSYHNYGMPTGWHLLFGPNITLSWLVIDFGGRSASLEVARRSLEAADWMQNSVIQDTVLAVELAYDRNVAAKALLASQQALVSSAQSGLDAAQARQDAGAGTIADVLQARTALSKAQLTMQTAEGTVRIARGTLAVALSLPATTELDTRFPLDAPIQAVTPKVEEFLEKAMAQRPDLQANRARWLAAKAHVDEMRAAALPSLSVTGSAGFNFIDGFKISSDPLGPNPMAAVTAGLLFHIPLFAGFTPTYATQEAEALAEAAGAQEIALENQIMLQVFGAYVTMQTAAIRAHTAAELVANARDSATVALERYQSGVGTIVELLAAQAAQADAESNEIQARLDWYASLAQLAHDTGLLGLQSDLSLDTTAPGPPKEAAP